METIQDAVNQAPMPLVIVFTISVLIVSIPAAIACKTAYSREGFSFAVVYLFTAALIFGACAILGLVALISRLLPDIVK